MGAAPITPSPDTAPQGLMPDMMGFSATPAPIGVGFYTLAPFAFFLLWLRQCLPRKGMRQSGKVSKTVNSCVALLSRHVNDAQHWRERASSTA
jgi:hypothetical protein